MSVKVNLPSPFNFEQEERIQLICATLIADAISNAVHDDKKVEEVLRRFVQQAAQGSRAVPWVAAADAASPAADHPEVGAAPPGTDADLIERAGTDAGVWAQEFMRVAYEIWKRGGAVDSGLMISWFANAIEKARSVERAWHDRRVTELLGANNREVERRREAERKISAALERISREGSDSVRTLLFVEQILLGTRDQ